MGVIIRVFFYQWVEKFQGFPLCLSTSIDRHTSHLSLHKRAAHWIFLGIQKFKSSAEIQKFEHSGGNSRISKTLMGIQKFEILYLQSAFTG